MRLMFFFRRRSEKVVTGAICKVDGATCNVVGATVVTGCIVVTGATCNVAGAIVVATGATCNVAGAINVVVGATCNVVAGATSKVLVAGLTTVSVVVESVVVPVLPVEPVCAVGCVPGCKAAPGTMTGSSLPGGK